jgi:prepilin peptidase CpaA
MWQILLGEKASLLVLAGLLVIAVANDLRSRRIPNWLVLTGIALGFAFQVFAYEGDGLFARWYGAIGPWQAFLGLLAGFTMFIPFHLLKVMGAGDVKLVAMLGVWFGVRPMVGVVLLSMVCGGVLALTVALWTRSLSLTLSNVRFMMTDTLMRVSAGTTPTVVAPARSHGRLPYAVAIAAGSLAEVILLKGWGLAR